MFHYKSKLIVFLTLIISFFFLNNSFSDPLNIKFPVLCREKDNSIILQWQPDSDPSIDFAVFKKGFQFNSLKANRSLFMV